MIHFLLTPDKSASLALKRLAARQGARMDVVVGTWPELLTLAKNCHILPMAANDWQTRLASAAKEQTGAFWSESLSNVPSEEQSILTIAGTSWAGHHQGGPAVAGGPPAEIADCA